jgi:hypothetical protein
MLTAKFQFILKERHYYLIVKPELQNAIMPGTETSNMTLKLIHYRKKKKQELPVAAMFGNGSGPNEQYL